MIYLGSGRNTGRYAPAHPLAEVGRNGIAAMSLPLNPALAGTDPPR